MENSKAVFLKEFDMAMKLLDRLREVHDFDFEDTDGEWVYEHSTMICDACDILKALRGEFESKEFNLVKTATLKEVIELEDFLREKGKAQLEKEQLICRVENLQKDLIMADKVLDKVCKNYSAFISEYSLSNEHSFWLSQRK
jgi:hypothetical protein